MEMSSAKLHQDDDGRRWFGVKITGEIPEWLKEKAKADEEYRNKLKQDMNRMLFGEGR